MFVASEAAARFVSPPVYREADLDEDPYHRCHAQHLVPKNTSELSGGSTQTLF
jgi:hypothetical protein